MTRAGRRSVRVAHSLRPQPLIHQPTGGYQGQSSDIEIHARETLALRAQLDRLYAKHTGQSAEQINADSERDRYMTPEEGVAYGLVDRIVQPRTPVD